MEDRTMKKTMLFSSALVALAMLASCQKEEFIETPATATGVTEFTATIESTKTAIDGNGNVTWTAGDEITVTDAESNSAVYVAASSGASTTFNLKPEETAVGAGPYKATYGDVTKQKYSATGANCPLTAQSSTTNFTFSSPYAVVKLTAKSSGGETIKTVVVTYGGKGFSLDCGEGVTLTSAGVDFYVAIEPASKTTTLSIAFYTADRMAKKTRNESISLEAKYLLSVTFNSFTWDTPSTTPTFKAVHNTTDGSLTFYYDNSLHVGEGVLYDNLPYEATKAADWGYNGVRNKIEKVAITKSVKNYKDLTSTAYMFQGMTIASDISGAEHLDVSKVTDMSYMFMNFGGGNTNSHTTLNSVPDVSKWNTANVTNMTGMFNSYGNFSDNLTIVPDVSKWNTANVTNMAGMFQKYGHESTGFNAVPDVSKWNTGKAEDMHQMFSEYGHKSTALTAVPDVCNWNTAEVKTMAEMFREYGATSTVLKSVPDVSNWKTGNVTDVANLFQNYGKGSVDFVLDLSGWDLSKILSNKGDNVFDFTPNTFKVTIPAKTDGKSNETGNWYYGQGGDGGSIIPPTDNTFTLLPADALAGRFSVSDTKKVHFSKGNLWYGKVDDEAEKATFNFEENQYSISSSWDANHVSNFYWSKTASVAYANSYTESGTSASDVFFTNATGFTVGGQTNVWRTLTRDEWEYLFKHHTYNYASVNGKHGIVIAPDGFSGTIADSYTTDWATAEGNGFCISS